MLLIALVALWKRPRLAATVIVLALGVLLLPSSGWISGQMVRSLEWQNISNGELPKADAIVVLGGAVRPQVYPRPWIDVTEAGDRPIYAAQLYLQKKAPLVILSGGRIEWQGGGPPESGDMAKLVEAMGVPASAIVQDPTSLNTYENAVNVKKIMQQRGIKRVLLITSAVHMPRSLAIFRKQGIDVIPAPTDFQISAQEVQEAQDRPEAILLNLLPNTENLNQFTRALKEYFGLGIYSLRGWL
jgi:uncharacterized SAM-binding protein YcdF (DUF218 family)